MEVTEVDVLRSSGPSGGCGMARRWYASRTVMRGCRRTPLSVACPRSPACTSIRSSAESSRRILSHKRYRHADSNRVVSLNSSSRALPRVIERAEADALLAALRRHRDPAMVQAMLGGLRRCEVLSLRLPDVASR